tara:strand:- start:96 stop:239 length:144 start_codon:yes stop_codon:yes gene_type:complete
MSNLINKSKLYESLILEGKEENPFVIVIQSTLSEVIKNRLCDTCKEP